MNSKEILTMKLKNKVLEQLIETINNKSYDELYVRIIRTDGKIIKEKLNTDFYTMTTWELSPCFNELTSYNNVLDNNDVLTKQIIDNTCAMYFQTGGCPYCNIQYQWGYVQSIDWNINEYCRDTNRNNEKMYDKLIEC